MKYRLLTSYLLTISVLLSFPLKSQPAAGQNVAKSLLYQVAQSGSSYRELMTKGYSAFNRKDYQTALDYFRRAITAARSENLGFGAAKRARDNTNRKITAKDKEIIATGAPGRTVRGGTRGNCFPTQQAPIPLVPSVEEAVLTTQEYPSFYFYIPKITEELKEVEFVLRPDYDNITPENVKPLYRQTFKVDSQDSINSQSGGIVKIRIPPDSKPLESKKRYVWGFSLICDRRKRDEDLYTEGKIERQQDEVLTAYLEQQIPIQDQQYFAQVVQRRRTLDRARLYSVGGFWEDALLLVADLRASDPNNMVIKEYWQDLLESLQQERPSEQQEQSSDGADVLDAINKPFLDLEPTDSELNILQSRPLEMTPSEIKFSEPTNSDRIPLETIPLK